MDVSPAEKQTHWHPGCARSVEYTGFTFELDKDKYFLKRTVDELNALTHDTKNVLIELFDSGIHEEIDERLDDLEEYYREERAVEREERRKEMLHG
jgi:hypothetical protein